jgi:hypothetical protein
MTLLLRDTDAKPGEQAGAPGPEAPPETRVCPQCQAPLEDGQDWCLNCGQARPGRLSSLPGKRAAATVLALTTVLVGGAVAASYAALQDGTATPGSTTQVAQVPAPGAADTSAAAPAPVDPSAVAPTTATPADPSATTPGGTGALPDAGSTPATPAPSPTPSASSGSGTSAASGSTGSGSTGSTGGSGSKGTSGSTKADTRTSTTPAQAAPTPIKVDGTAAALYDPFSRNTATGDAAKALDGDPGTSFPVTVAAGASSIGAGLTVDLGKVEGLREIDLTTKTPGFKVEIYATDSDELPPDVLDTRWAHLKDVTNVGSGAGNKQIVSLGSGTSKYRHVLLWFTTPPTDGLTVRVSELKLLG